jgi:hypothetical protein
LVHDFANEVFKLAEKQEGLEKNSKQPLFLNRLRNLFTFGSYKTDSEYGKALSAKIDAYPTRQLSANLKACIFRGLGRGMNELSPEDKLDNMKEEFNKLKKKDFKILLKEVIFSRKETDWGRTGTNKLAFFERLTPANQKIFIEELLKTSNWKDQLMEMMRKSRSHEQKVLDDLIKTEVVSKLQSDDPQKRKQWIATIDLHLDGCKDFFADLIIKTMLSYVKEANFIECVNLKNQLNKEMKKICYDYLNSHRTGGTIAAATASAEQFYTIGQILSP